MTLQIDLPADVQARLRDEAARRGLEASAYARQIIEEHLPPKPAESLAALFAEWDAEDATDDPAELERRNREFAELQRALNRNRLEMEGPGSRKVFP